MDRDLVELLEKAAAQYERGRREGWTLDSVHDYRVAIRRDAGVFEILARRFASPAKTISGTASHAAAANRLCAGMGCVL